MSESADELAHDLREAGISEDDANLAREYAEEQIAAAHESGKLSELYGLKAFGATDEGVAAAISAGARLAKQGYYLQATEFFAGLLQLEPFNPKVHMWLGLCALRQKLPARGMQFFRQAHGLDADEPLYLFYLGEAALLCGERDEGLAALNEGLKKVAGKKGLESHAARARRLLEVQKMIDERRAQGAKGG